MTVLVWLLLATIPPQAPQPVSTSTPAAGQASAAADLPVSLPRIRRALAVPPALKPDDAKPVFRVEVFGPKPTILDFIGTDVFKGPVPHGSAFHQEFLEMVTPVDVRGYAAFSNTEGAVVAVTSFESALLLKAAALAVRGLRAAHKSSARRAAVQEVADALAELEQARRAAGLPPK